MHRLSILIISIFFTIGCNHSKEKINTAKLVAYAESFEPCSNNECSNLYNTPDEIKYILENGDTSYLYKKAVILVLLKHYTFELETFHQGYELRKTFLDEHPQSKFVDAFLRIDNSPHGDFMSGEVAYDWVKSHPEFLDDLQISQQMEKIKLLEKNASLPSLVPISLAPKLSLGVCT